MASILFPTCHSCFLALPNLRLSPSETILKLLDVTLPADHVLKNILLMAGTSGVLSLQVLKEIRQWVCQSTLRVTDFKPVTRWSLGKFHDKGIGEVCKEHFGIIIIMNNPANKQLSFTLPSLKFWVKPHLERFAHVSHSSRFLLGENFLRSVGQTREALHEQRIQRLRMYLGVGFIFFFLEFSPRFLGR